MLDLFDGLSYTQAVALGGIETSNAESSLSRLYSAGSLLSSGESSMSRQHPLAFGGGVYSYASESAPLIQG